MKVTVVIPTYNASHLWKENIEALKGQTVDCHKLIVDSSSQDGTDELAKGSGFSVLVIKKELFDHGGTRQMALEHVGEADVVVYLTQDAILADSEAIAMLVAAFDDEKVGIVYGRQLPNKEAKPIEGHARLFNYPDESHRYKYNDRGRVGLKVAFNSNSFSAYRLSVLNEVGGFKSDIIFGEDMLVAADVLKAGYDIVYCSAACVYHSHAYSLKQEFQRYFDMGVMHDTEKWLLSDFGKPVGEGFRFIKSEYSYLLKKAPWRIPEALIRTFMKFTGYRLGLSHSRLSHSLKIMFSMNKQYWNK